MNSISKILSVSLISLVSATAIACPKGTTLQGGTGPNHKGGHCVTTSKNKMPMQANTVNQNKRPTTVTHPTTAATTTKHRVQPHVTPAKAHPAAQANARKPQIKS